jgi:hypothetical protein
MKRKRFDTLKAEEVKLPIKSKRKGSFIVEPSVLYFDENRNAESQQTEPIAITEKELGIKG